MKPKSYAEDIRHCTSVFIIKAKLLQTKPSHSYRDQSHQKKRMQPDMSLPNGSVLVGAPMPSIKRGGFKVTFACRMTEALRNNSGGCGAVVGIMRYNKMRRDADAASWEAVSATVDENSVVCIRHDDHLLPSPHTASGSSSVRATTPDVAAKTPISNDDADEMGFLDDHGFETNRRYGLDVSRDSSWVLASPCRSCGWATPASIRRSASCTTNDAATEHSASDEDGGIDDDGDANVAQVYGESPSLREWDILPQSPHHAAFAARHRRLHPAATPVRILKPM